MKGLKALLLLTVFAATTVLAAFPSPLIKEVRAGVPSSIGIIEGPHFGRIVFKIFANSQAEVDALRTGEIDVVDFFEAESLPEIKGDVDAGRLKVATLLEQGIWGLSLQTQRYPLTIKEFRQAIAHLVDKDLYVREGLQGLGVRIDAYFGSPGYGSWSAQDLVVKYEFSPSKASQILDDLGFTKGPDGKRIDPETGKAMRPLVIIARTEHAHRIFSARQLAKQLDALGIPYELKEVPRRVASPLVFVQNDYDIYTAGWGGGPDVDWIYDNFHSSQPNVQNYELYRSERFDRAAEKAKFGGTYEEALEGVLEAQRVMAEEVPFIPLYAKLVISPYNARLENAVPLPVGGVTHALTFLQAYDREQKYGSTLKVGWSSDLTQPSPLFEINWWWDSMAISTIFDSLIALDPVTFKEIPWLAKEWQVEPWTSPDGSPGQKITFKLIEDALWHDGLPLTAEDVAFTWLYIKREQNPVYIAAVKDIVKAEALDRFTAVVYYSTPSYWALHWAGFIPIIPKHIWEGVTDSVRFQPVAEGKLIGSGPHRLKDYRPGEFFMVEANPNYFLRPRDSTLALQTITLNQGDVKVLPDPPKSLVVSGKPVTDGKLTLALKTQSGLLLKTIRGTASPDGTYSARLDTADIEPGTYLLMIELKAPVTAVGAGSVDEYRLVVMAPPLMPPALIAILVAGLGAAACFALIGRRPKPKRSNAF